MDSESYLYENEAIKLMEILNAKKSVSNWDLLNEIGLQWTFQRGKYQIIDRKRWFLGKIKYGF